QLCGHWLGAGQTVYVYLINGRPDDQGMFSFPAPAAQGSFVACSVTDTLKPNDWEWMSVGAVGKCLIWPREQYGTGWKPVANDPASQKAFNACLRAVRADYCGTGVTHTVDGTPIELYGMNENHVVTWPYLLEATWNEKGAICLIHARWASLSPG